MRAPIARARPRSSRDDDGTAQLSIRDLVQVTPPPIRQRGRAGSRVRTPPVSTFEQSGEAFGAYVLHERIGEGGMAQVNRAERVGAGGVRHAVALKRLWSHLSEDPDFVEAFVHEAQLACRLRHDNIARAYELGKVDGVFYIAMELVSGPTLGQILAQSRTAAGAIPLPIVVSILIQLCDALAYAHDEQIIHRDISPANVIISNTGVVKLIDFGIAKAATSRQTQAGIIKGKLAYVAPEYTYGQLDARADLFSLGVVAYELITGMRLMLGESPFETITNIREKPIQPPSRYNAQVSHDLDDIVQTAVQRDPSLRWQNAAAMRNALAGVARELPAVTGEEIRAWIEWAFSKQPRTEHSIARVLDTLEPSLLIELKNDVTAVTSPDKPSAARRHAPTAQLRGPSGAVPAQPHPDTVPTIVRVRTTESVRAMAPPRKFQSAPTEPPRLIWPWLVLLLMAAVAVQGAVYVGWLDVSAVLSRF